MDLIPSPSTSSIKANFDDCSLLIYIFFMTFEVEIVFFVDLQNWENNFRFTVCTKHVNQQRNA